LNFGPPFLYPIVDTEVCRARGLDPVRVAEAYLSGGARMLQLRHKGGSSASFLELADSLVSLARAVDALVVINDRADIARLSGAGGVHVGQDDLSPRDVRKVVGAEAVVGLSTHDERQIDAALAGEATYIAVGPIFGTATKETGYSARGVELLGRAVGRGKPVVAIGGITLDRVPDLVAAGAAGIAVISDLLTGTSPEARTREFMARLTDLRRTP
jgi:thiamine-phosphate pyrophosphorylase